MKNGISEEAAFTMDPILRQGLAIIFSEHEGAEFDTATMKFKERK